MSDQGWIRYFFSFQMKINFQLLFRYNRALRIHTGEKMQKIGRIQHEKNNDIFVVVTQILRVLLWIKNSTLNTEVTWNFVNKNIDLNLLYWEDLVFPLLVLPASPQDLLRNQSMQWPGLEVSNCEFWNYLDLKVEI